MSNPISQTPTERLAYLATLLESPLPPNTHFDLSLYYSQRPYGTVCCALGLAALTPVFKAQGFRMGSITPTYGGWRGFAAAMHFFGLTYAQVQGFFSIPAYPNAEATTPEEVATRLRQYLSSLSA